MASSGGNYEFLCKGANSRPKGSVLYDEHLKMTRQSLMADFAGYLMPLWYDSISAEHNAVRQRAGLFDCTHMGVLEVKGDDAGAFLNMVATNDIDRLSVGKAQYSYILDAAGNVLDDIIIYRRGQSNLMLVVNACNEPKIKAYLKALLDGRAVVSPDEPDQKIPSAKIRDMRDLSGGEDCRVDIALQGPASAELIYSLLDKNQDIERLERVGSFGFIETTVNGIEVIIARTGYTGAKVGFEFYIHPERAVELWQLLLQRGKNLGVVPCGLGARDSLRVEAGLPLYGHELAGDFNISPFEAGYGWAVKLDKDFFIGKAAMQKRAENYDMEVVRVQLPGERGVRPARQGDGVLDSDGKCIGLVLSCANAGEKQYALCYVARGQLSLCSSLGIYYLARSESQKLRQRKERVEKGEKLQADIAGEAVSRFAKF